MLLMRRRKGREGILMRTGVCCGFGTFESWNAPKLNSWGNLD